MNRRYLNDTRHLRHHAFAIEAEAEEGIEIAQTWVEKELGMKAKNPSTKLGASNPDVVVLRYGLFSVADARRVLEVAASVPLAGENKVLIISASRAYHEAQNALLKLFEEPPPGMHLFLVLPSLGGLLPTLRSRVQVLQGYKDESIKYKGKSISKEAEEFIKASKERRSAIIKKLTSGKDEEERRELRDEAIEIVNGVEAAAYQQRGNTLQFPKGVSSLLNDIAVLRSHLYDRSAPVKMILEHLSLVIPRNL